MLSNSDMLVNSGDDSNEDMSGVSALDIGE